MCNIGPRATDGDIVLYITFKRNAEIYKRLQKKKNMTSKITKQTEAVAQIISFDTDTEHYTTTTHITLYTYIWSANLVSGLLKYMCIRTGKTRRIKSTSKWIWDIIRAH